MFRTLMRKQLHEAFSGIITLGRKGKSTAKKSVLLIGILLLFVVGVMGFSFGFIGYELCSMLVPANLAWLYLAIMSTLATVMGVVGGVFTAYSSLYQAKDNELLLAMPIPVYTIMFVRLIGVYVITALFEAIVFIPSLVAYWLVVHVEVLSLVFAIGLLFVMPLLATSICCILCYLISIIVIKFPPALKTILSTLIVLAFIGLYMWFYSAIEEVIAGIIVNSATISGVYQVALYPFAQFGYALCGSAASFFVCVLICILITAIAVLLLSLSFAKMLKGGRQGAKIKYKEKRLKQSSVLGAVLKKEFSAFFKGGMIIILNTSVGSIFLFVLAVAVFFIKGDLLNVSAILESMTGLNGVLFFVSLFAMCVAVGANTLAAPSISLEYDTMWVLKSMPIKPSEIILAKIAVHAVITAVPALLCSTCISVALGFDWLTSIAFVVLAVAFSLLTATLDFYIGLKFPKFDGSGTMAVVKQSMCVGLSMLSGIILSVLTVVLEVSFSVFLPIPVSALVTAFVVSLVFVVVALGLKNWAIRRFGNL